jgi:hypothetical protein
MFSLLVYITGGGEVFPSYSRAWIKDECFPKLSAFENQRKLTILSISLKSKENAQLRHVFFSDKENIHHSV